MSILKSILHHYNKTTKSYDTLHPETEVAQVTDWDRGIVNTLASTALGGLVNTLTSDSLLASMIQKVLTATGVKYNMAQNGYICLGSLFGGLIIQWGYARANKQGYVLSYPVTMTTLCAIVSTNLDNSSSPVTPATISCFRPGTSNVRLVSNVDGSPETLSIIIGM